LADDAECGGVRHVAVVFNPVSGVGGSGDRRPTLRALLAARRLRTSWFETSMADPGEGCVRTALAAGADLVLVCGGDGTVMTCAGALIGTSVPLAVIPGGTGNIIATSLRVPRGTRDAVETALHGARRRIDVGVVDGGQPFFAAGMGFSASVMRDATPALKRRAGMFAYFLSAVRHLRDPARTFRVWLDDQPPIVRRANGVLVGNFGELMSRPRLPRTGLDDGLFEVGVLTVRPVSDWARRDLAFAHSRRRPPPLDWFQAASVRITCDVPQPIERDGEFTGLFTELRARVLAGSVLVCAPAQKADAGELRRRRLIDLLAYDARRLLPRPRGAGDIARTSKPAGRVQARNKLQED
jgi:diacylglycerol kinase (ATP)